VATFGKTDNGTGTTSSSVDRKKVMAAVPATTGTVSSISIRGAATAGGSTVIKGVIYSDNGSGSPDTLMAVSNEITVNSTTEQEWVGTFPTPITVIAGTTYHIGWIQKSPGFVLSRNSSNLSPSRTNTDTYADGPTTTFGTATDESGPLDVYVTYIEDPAGEVEVFSTSWETGDFTAWNSCQWTGRNDDCSTYDGTSDYSATVVAIDGRPHVARWEVRDGDIPPFGGGERAEVGEITEAEVGEGDERWLAFDLKFPVDFPNPTTDTASGWFVVFQYHPLAGGSSPSVAFEVDTSGNLILTNANEAPFTQSVTVGSIQRGAWVRYVLHAKFSTSNSTGFIQIYQNGVEVVPQTPWYTLYGSGNHYLKMGIYRDPDNTDTAVVYHDNLRITAPTDTGGGSGGTTPVVRSASSGGEDNSPTVTVTKPSGLAVGDYLLAFHESDADGGLASMSAPAGFAELSSQAPDPGTNIPAGKVWGKVADASDVAASTFAFPDATGANCSVVLLAIQEGTFDPEDPTSTPVWASQGDAAGTNITAPTTTGVLDGLLLTGHMADTGGTVRTFSTAPSGMTLTHQSAAGTSTYTRIAVYQESLSASGATGTRSAVLSASPNGWIATSLVVNPAPSAGGGTAQRTAGFLSLLS